MAKLPADLIRHGQGSPEGAVSGRVGTLYLQLNGSGNVALWLKISGSGNTGWKKAIVEGQSALVTAAMLAAGAVRSVLMGNGNNVGVATGTHYLGFGQAGATTTNNIREAPLPYACTLKNLRVYVSGAQPADGSLVFTVRVQDVDSAVVATVPAGSTDGIFSDASNSAAGAAGDRLEIKVVNNSPSTSILIRGFSLEVAV